MVNRVFILSATAASFLATLGSSASLPLQRRGGSPSPNLTFDPNTDPNCSWWWDADDGLPCEVVVQWSGLAMTDFAKWNPSVKSCADWKDGHSYCVEVAAAPEPPQSTTFVPPTPTTVAAPTTTKPSNGVSTPEPFQPGMTTSCNKFHKVVSGDQCNVLATKYGIALSDLMKWNPAVGSACQSLWLDYYVCVGLIGASQPNPPPSPTATQGNGIPTPEPTQPGMVGNCNRFYKVVSGDTCVVVASKAGISTTQFAAWNPQTGGAACSSLWLGYYVCTGVVGTAPSPPTPTQPGNGVATPTPIQAGMVGNCKKFHFVKPGETCAVIAANNRISTSDFIRWNPAAGSSCTGLWANTYACIGV